jgi:hypothetical protein
MVISYRKWLPDSRVAVEAAKGVETVELTYIR